MKESNLINTNNPVNEGDLAKSNKNIFYQEKMKNITDGGIGELLKNLSSDFCNSKYHADKKDLLFNMKPKEERENYLKQWKEKCKKAKAKANSKGCFNPPSFSWTGNDDDKEFAPFIFFETVDPKQIQDDEAIANYVKQFVYYINQLLSDEDFGNFVFHEFATAESNNRNKNIVKFVNQIDSDFFTKCDEANLELFKDSGLLYIGEQLFNHFSVGLARLQFIEYLKKTPAIPVIVLKELLFANYFYDDLKELLFADYFYDDFSSRNNIVDVIIKSIAKTDFSSWSYSKRYKDELSAFGYLLDQNNHGCNEENFYINYIKDTGALINKCAKTFSKPETRKIKLYDFMTKTPYKNAYFFVSDYLKDNKNKNSPVRKTLIDGLKTLAKNNDNFIDYDAIKNLTSASYIDSRFHYTYFFPCDTEFNEIIAAHCNNAVNNHLKTINDPYERMEKYWSIKSSVENFFSIKLNIEINFDDAFCKSHGKDAGWLSLWIFLLLVCSGAMIAGFILIPITPLKFVCLIMLYPISKIYDPMKEKCIKIHNDRIYNAKLCIYKATSKSLAINNLSWDMLRYDEIKRTINNRFPGDENPLGSDHAESK